MIISRPSLEQIVGGVAVCEAVGLAAVYFTSLSVNSWYQTLTLPSIAPADWVFAPVWIIFYAILGVALAYLLASPLHAVGRTWALRWFWIQLALNFSWSATFFGWRAPAAGYAVICALWCAIAALMWTGARAARPTLWLLLPCFIWVTFASTLNFGILSLNVLKPQVEVMDADPANADAPLSQQGLMERNRKRAEEDARRKTTKNPR